MTTLAEDFKAYLLTKAPVTALVGSGIAARVHHNRVPEASEGTRICFFRRQTLVERATDETAPEPTTVSFDVECGSGDLGDAEALAAAVRAALDGYRGALGARTVQGVFVEDHDEDYVPHANESDDVLHVATFQVEIFP